jgi:hypothetical protein
LSAWPSLCTTCARNPGKARQDLALKARIEVRAERLGIVGDPGLDAGLEEQRPLDVPGDEVARVRVEEPPQPACELCLEGGGVPKRIRAERLALGERRPGSQLSTRTIWRLPSAAAIHSRSLPRFDAMTRGTGRSGAKRSR